jgi:hypothetical protein
MNKVQLSPLLVSFGSNEQALKALKYTTLDIHSKIDLMCSEIESIFTVIIIERFRANENTPISCLKFLIEPDGVLNSSIYQHFERPFIILTPKVYIQIPISITEIGSIYYPSTKSESTL